MTLYVKIKNVFGKDLLYPDCPESKFLCELCNSRIITDPMRRILISQGYSLATRSREVAHVR